MNLELKSEEIYNHRFIFETVSHIFIYIHRGKGVYYLQTNSESIFSRGKKGLLDAVLSAKKKISLKTIAANLFMKKANNETLNVGKKEKKNEIVLMKSLLANR